MRKQKKIRGWGWLIGLAVVMVVGLGVVARKGKQGTVNEITPETPSIEKKVLVLNFDPILENYGGVRLHEYFRWNDPATLEQEYIDAVKETSHGYVNYKIVEKQTIDAYPVKKSNFQYNDEIYVSCIDQLNACYHHTPYYECLKKIPQCNTDRIDFKLLLNEYDVCKKVNLGTIDELWLWGGPHFRYYEANMAGYGSFPTNGPVVIDTDCKRALHIMGFNFERTVSEMLENLLHRTEGTMREIYHSYPPYYSSSPNPDRSNPWTRFWVYDKVAPGKSGCGTVHYPPNGERDYDWQNLTKKSSYCIDWDNQYPLLEGDLQPDQDCNTWGCTGLGYKKWLLSHIPNSIGNTDGKVNNWWKYIVDFENNAKYSEENPHFLSILSGDLDTNTSCTFNKTGSTILLGKSDCSKNFKAELIFKDIRINRGEKLNKVYLSLLSAGDYSIPMSVSISASYNKYKTATKKWDLTQAWSLNQRVESIDITDVLSEVISLPIWQSGGSINIMIESQSGEGQRAFYAYEHDGPMLGAFLVYELSSTPSPSASPSVVPSPSFFLSPSPSFTPSPSPTASASPRTGPGDYNVDGCVTLKDYQLVMTKWGNPYTNTDLQLIKANFGKCY